MRLGRIATLAMLAIVASVPAMAQTITRSGEPFNPPAVSVRRYVTRMVDSLGGHKAGMRDSAVWETPARTLPVPLPIGGMYQPDTSSRVLATDNSGNLYATDPYMPPWGPGLFMNAINDTFTVGNALTATASTTQTPYCFDSTAVIPFNAAGFTRATLFMRSIAPSDSSVADTTSITYWGVQVRKHISAASDTNSTAIWYEWAQRATGANGVADTVSSWGASAAFSYPHTPALAFPGERVFKFDDHQGGANVNQPASSMTGPPMIAVDLGSPNAPFAAGYFSVRVHCIARVKSLANANPSRRPRFILHVVLGN